MHVTVSRRFLEKLAAAKAAISHSFPGGNDEAILGARPILGTRPPP